MSTKKLNSNLAFLNGLFEIINGLLSCCTSEDLTMVQLVEYMSNFKMNKESSIRLTYMTANMTKDRVFSSQQLEGFLDAVPKNWNNFVFNKIKSDILSRMCQEDFLIMPNILAQLIINLDYNDDVIHIFGNQDIYIQQILSYESGRRFGYDIIKRAVYMYENDFGIRFNSIMYCEWINLRHLIFDLIENYTFYN